MAKKKTFTVEDRLNFELQDRLNRIRFVSDPTYFFNIGDSVHLGNLYNVKVVEILEDGKLYKLSYNETSEKTSYENGKTERITVVGDVAYRYAFWHEIRPISTCHESLIQNDNIHLSFSNRTISSILGNVYYFGTDMNPEYQREYVWTEEDKVKLVDSIFRNIDIGKFVFVHNSYHDEYLYQILDGKQRIRAILDFYENRFPYKGKFFNDLSVRDQNWFCDKTIAVAEVERASKQDLLRYFIILNTAGKTMSEEHIQRVRELAEND